MSITKDILKLAPTMQSAHLIGGLTKKKKKKPVKDFMDIMVGTEFIKAESNLIGGLD